MNPASTSSKNKSSNKSSTPAAVAKPIKKSAKAAKPDTKSKKAAKPLPKAKVVKVEPAAATAAAPTAPQVTDEQISQRAYEIWVEKGRPYGQEDANWAQAIAELRG